MLSVTHTSSAGSPQPGWENAVPQAAISSTVVSKGVISRACFFLSFFFLNAFIYFYSELFLSARITERFKND